MLAPDGAALLPDEHVIGDVVARERPKQLQTTLDEAAMPRS